MFFSPVPSGHREDRTAKNVFLFKIANVPVLNFMGFFLFLVVPSGHREDRGERPERDAAARVQRRLQRPRQRGRGAARPDGGAERSAGEEVKPQGTTRRPPCCFRFCARPVAAPALQLSVVPAAGLSRLQSAPSLALAGTGEELRTRWWLVDIAIPFAFRSSSQLSPRVPPLGVLGRSKS